MPSIAERFKPSIKERLSQSAADKSLRGKRKKKQETKKPPEQKPTTATTVHRLIQAVTQLVQDDRATGGWWGADPGCYHTGPCNCGTVTFDTTGGTITHTTTWANWNNAFVRQVITQSSAVTSTNVWQRWVDVSPYGYPVRREPFRERVQVQESEEQRRARELERQHREEQYRKQQEESRLALERARALLLSCMTPEQQDTFTNRSYFDVKAKSGRVYRLNAGTHGNIHVIDKNGKVIERLCIQPGGVPLGDSLLTQKLMIETAEDIFRQHANITLADTGRILHGVGSLLTGEKLADVIQLHPPAPPQQPLIRTA